MPRDNVMGLMKALKFIAIPKAYDEVLAAARKRRQMTEVVIEQLLEIEVSERQARSIRYRMTQARFPVPKDIDSFEFEQLSIDEQQIRTLYTGEFIEQQRNIVFVGGTGTGKTHLATAIASQAIRSGYRAKFFNLVDLANQLEQEKLNDKGGWLDTPNWWCWMSSAICRSQTTGASSSFICSHICINEPRSSSPPIWPLANGLRSLVTRK